MNETEIFNYIFRGTAEFGDVQRELAELLVINEKLKNQNLEHQALQRKLVADKKSAAEEAKAAAIAEINARLGIQNGIKTELGLIEKLRNEIKLLKSAREQANNVTDVNKYTGAIQSAQKELNTLTGVTDKFRGSNGFWQDLKGQVMAYWAAVQVGDVGKTLINNEVRLESLRLALRNVLTTQEEYTQSLAFLDKLSNKYGQDITILTDTYKNFIAASQSSGLELKERQRIYEAIVKSGAALSLSNEEIEGSLRAVSQMFSKGNVQAEELRGQLGERLPGAFGLAAKALGVTEAKLNDMLKAGEVLAVDLLPKLATELEKSFGDKAANNVNLVTGAYNRLSNAIKAYFGGANQTYGITDKIAKGFNFLANNLEAVVKVGTTLISTIIAYTIASKAAGVASAAWTVIEKAGLIIKGEAILLTRQQAIANATLTDTQLTAAAAAQTFNNTLLKNPIGLIVLAIGTAIAAYQLYESSTKAAREEQEKLNTQIADAIAPIELQKREFNLLASEVLKGVVPLQKQYETLEALKKQHPELLKGVTNLTEAERILNENKIKVNTQDDYRLEKLEVLKKKYPEQLTGINNLKDAEQKLSGVLKEVNADFAVRALMLEADIKYNVNKEKATNLIKDQIVAEENLGKLRIKLARERTVLSLEEDSEQQLASRIRISGYEEQQKQIEGTIRAQKAGVINLIGVNQGLTKLQEEQRKKLKYNYDEEATITKTGEDKKTKIKADSSATQALIAEKTRITELEKTEVQEQRLLAIDKDIAIQRIKDSKLKAIEKASAIYKIEEKFKQDLNKLTQKYDDIEEKELQKTEKKRIEFRIATNKALDKIEVDSSKSMIEQIQEFAILKTNIDKENYVEWLKTNKKFLDDGIALDKKYIKEYQKLQEDKYELIETLRTLDRIKEAKDAEEVVKIEKEEKEKILKNNETYYQRVHTLESLKLSRIRDSLGEESNEYKEQKIIVTQAAQDMYGAIIDFAKFKTESVKEGFEEDAKNAQKALSYIGQLTGAIFGMMERDIENSLSKTTDLVERAQLESQKGTLSIVKNGLNAISSFVTGDIVGGILGVFETLDSALHNLGKSSERLAQARFEAAKKELENFLEVVRKDVEQIVNSIDKIADAYKELDPYINTNYGLYQQSTLADLIEKEIEHGQQIIDNYNTAVDKVNEWYNKETNRINETYDLTVKKENDAYNNAIKNLNEQYDLEIRRINEKYDLIGQKAQQQYNAETLAIMQQGSVQLEALIKNEESLASVRAEFAAKRQFINETFALANKQLTEDSTQAEIDAVNAAIKARDAALAELQGWYNDELAFIVENEGQKRKEYTDTERVQNEIQENLDKAALKFQADEIQRAQDKATEIAKAEETKNGLIQQAQIAHNIAMAGIEAAHVVALEQLAATYQQYLINLETDKNAQIAASYKRLQELLVVEIDTITRALENSAAKGTEAYRALEAELQRVKNLLDAIGGTNVPLPTIPPIIVPPFDPIVLPTGFKDGTVRLPNLSGKPGRDKELILADKGERITPTWQNDILKRHFNRDISGSEMVARLTGQFDFEGIANTGKNTSSTDPRLVNAINGLTKKMDNLKQVSVNVQNGVPTIEERSSNRMIKYTKP